VNWGREAVAAATAAVFVGGDHVGSAVLVDDGHLLTATHVLGKAAAPVEVTFPNHTAAPHEPLRVTVLPTVLADPGTPDVAILQIDSQQRGARPVPVSLAAGLGLAKTVSLFGYPQLDHTRRGVWRDLQTAGPVAGGLIQLDWVGPRGALRGHSGGPVLDAQTGRLVGILVEGATDAGGFERYLPLAVIRRVWPQLPRPWAFVGNDARWHARQRSRGWPGGVHGGDLFHGRAAALGAISSWFTAAEPPQLPLVVTGQPGAGKSAVLARAALAAEARQDRDGLFFHAQGATVQSFWAALCELVGLPEQADVEALGKLLEAREQLLLVAVDALDEAVSEEDRAGITQLIKEVAGLPTVRMVVATRRLVAGDPYRWDSPLHRLGATDPAAGNVVDLDDDRFFRQAELRVYAAELLARHGFAPAPSGLAWERYRADEALRDRLAARIAARAGRNYLVAALAALAMSEESKRPKAPDPRDPEFNDQQIPASVGEALDRYLRRIPPERGRMVETLLTALAYARGSGLDDARWLAFSTALSGQPVAVDVLDELFRTPAADYLLQESSDDQGTRLFHRALAEQLIARRRQYADEGRLTESLLAEAATTGWAFAPEYVREHIAAHAAAAGRLDELLATPDYLVVADPATLLPYLHAARGDAAKTMAAIYRQASDRLIAGNKTGNATHLNLIATIAGAPELAKQIADAVPVAVHVRWAHLDQRVSGQALHQHVLRGHTSPVTSVATGALPDGTPLVVSGSWDKTVRIWRLEDGLLLDTLRGHTSQVTSVATGALPDGTPVVVSGSDDETVRIWRLEDGGLAAGPLRHDGVVISVATGALPDGTPIVVSGSRDAVRIWRLDDGEPVGDPVHHDGCSVTAAATGTLPDGTSVVVSGWQRRRFPRPPAETWSSDKVRVWRLADRKPVGVPLRDHNLVDEGEEVTSVAMGVLPDGTPVVASGSDRAVRTWRPEDGGPGLRLSRGGFVAMRSVATGVVDGTPVIVSGGSLENPTVGVWRLEDGRLLDTLRGHTHEVTAVAIGRLPDGAPVVVSGSYDDTVRIWRLELGPSVDESRSPHPGEVGGIRVASGVLRDGTPVVVSSSHDHRAVRIWRLEDGEPVGDPLLPAGLVTSVATGALADGTPVVLCGTSDTRASPFDWRRYTVSKVRYTVGTVWVWRLGDGRPDGQESLGGHDGAVMSVATAVLPDGTPVAVSGSSDDETVRIWRLADGALVGEHPIHDPAVQSIASAVLSDGTPVMVSADVRWMRVWRLEDGEPVCNPIDGHDEAVMSVATGALPDGTPVVVSGGLDRTMRIWRLEDLVSVDYPLPHDGWVTSVATGGLPDGTLVVVSGSWDAAVRIWRLQDRRLLGVIDERARVSSVLLASSSMLVVTTTYGIFAHALPRNASRALADTLTQLRRGDEANDRLRDASYGPKPRLDAIWSLGEAETVYLATVSWREPAPGDERRAADLLRRMNAAFADADAYAEALRVGYDRFGRMVLQNWRTGAAVVEQPTSPPSERYPDSAELIGSSHDMGGVVVLVRLPDGRCDLLPADPRNDTRGFTWGYGGTGPHALIDALAYALFDHRDPRYPARIHDRPQKMQTVLTQIVTEQLKYDEPLRLSVGQLRAAVAEAPDPPEDP
jgi:WD40 repeat protein